MGGTTGHRREDTATSFRTLTSIDVHSPATPSLAPAPRHHATSQQRISSAGRISPSNSSPPEFPPPRPLPRHPWQRSASCRDLYASSFEDSGKARSKNDNNSTTLPLEPFQLPSQGELDKPVTRYDETNRSYSAASSKLPSLDHDPIPDKVYSSSYPGTSSLSTESGHEESGPAGDLSHDDLSHDSYELLEREHEFEYPESYSSPQDEPASENSDEGIEHELFQMDSDTDAFVKHKPIKASDRPHLKSVLADIKSMKTKSIDWYPATAKPDAEFLLTESRIQRSNTQIERKFETRHADSIDQQNKHPAPQENTEFDRRDPMVTQVQKQKVNLLNELKNLRPKSKITHVDSEVLRDEGIMRPKSRIDDDLSPGDQDRMISDHGMRRTTRARSIASLDERPPRPSIETGSLGRGHRSRERKTRETEAKMEKLLSKMQERERRSLEREERKRVERENSREARRMEKADSRERRSMDRLDSRERRSMERLDSRDSSRRRSSIDRDDSREARKSLDRLDFRDKTYERVDPIQAFSTERLDSQDLKKNTDRDRDRSYSRNSKDKTWLPNREHYQMQSRNTIDYDQRHTLERFDSGNKSPFERLGSRVPRGKSVERLDVQDQLTFDFDIRAIESLNALERLDSKDSERKSLEKMNSKERRSLERKSLDRIDSRERRSLERLDARDVRDRQGSDAKKTIDRLDSRESKKGRVNVDRKPERGKSEDKPRERDDWKSLEKARKDDERREKERQNRLSVEFRTESDDQPTNPSVFTEYDPMIVGGVVLGFDETSLLVHNPVERTKSDPNPARQRIGSNSKRHMLTHQKSIDLTPADSGDEDAFLEGITTQKCNVDIPYTLHKRHVMNGTASDEKSESDSGKTSKNGVKNLAKDLLKPLPLTTVTNISCLDLTKLVSPDKTMSLSPERPKSILISPDKIKPSSILTPKSILSPTSKLSPTDQKLIVSSLPPPPADESAAKSSPKISPGCKIPPKSLSLDRVASKGSPIDRLGNKSSSLDRKSSKLSPTDTNLVTVSATEKKKSSDRSPRSPNSGKVSGKADSLGNNSQSQEKLRAKLTDILGTQIKQKLERREKEKLRVPDDTLEKQDSIENVPLPEIPVKFVDSDKPPLPIKQRSAERPAEAPEKPSLPVKPPLPPKQHIASKNVHPGQLLQGQGEKIIEVTGEHADKIEKITKMPDSKSRVLEKPSIPEKTKRILDKIESRFTEINKHSPSKVTKPKIIDTGFDDFVDPVADLPLDDVPVKPALEFDSLKVPEFTPFMLRPHAEPLRCKSLSLAEEKAPIDTLLSPELENKSFVQEISPKRSKTSRSASKKDFKKQSKSLEGDKPPLKKTSSKELKTSPANSKIDKSKLKIGEMPQEIIIIDSTDVEPEISIVQKGRSKSVTRLSDRSFSTSKDEKDEFKKSRIKSTSVDDELIKGPGNLKNDKPRPRSLGISKSLGSTEKKEFVEKVSPKRSGSVRSTVRTEYAQGSGKSETGETATTNSEIKLPPSKPEVKSDGEAEVQETKVSGNASNRVEKQTDAKKSSSSNQDLGKSPGILRKPGQIPILFARARLGLSEGSALGTLQRQGATQSPTAQRRAKSLDAPVISVHRLPPANAFSSKDDTVDIAEEIEERDNISEENFDGNQNFKPHSVQLEASPNHISDSTDHTTIPEMLTDSLSVTETSAQYLESPLTECNEIVTCPDLIPYEHEAQIQAASRHNSGEPGLTGLNGLNRIDKLSSSTKFIDQSSVESGAELDAIQEDSKPRVSAYNVNKSQNSSFEVKSKTEFSSETDSSDPGGRDPNRKKKASPQHPKVVAHKNESLCQNNETEKEKQRDEDSPRVRPIVNPPRIEASFDDQIENDTLPECLKLAQNPNSEMVRSPIQISIEECSDDEIVVEDENNHVFIENDDQQWRKPRLDSGDTSEDTLDALDSQVQGGDSELSSPDYGVEKMDEKTLVEVELTPEYLDMRKEDDEAAEELPEDEPITAESKVSTDPNRMPVEKKSRLSTERSASEETNTWTPDREDPDSSSCSIARPLGIGRVQPIIDRKEIAIMKETRRDGSQEEESSSGSLPIQKMEFSSTWKPFPLESSGSSSLEDGWFPPDDNNHHQSQSEDSNGQNEDSFQEDLMDFPAGFGYPIGPDILANYGGAFSLSRTLSRISERSTTSEQDKSDMEDSFKPSSRSPSLDDESLISSDHQPSLSSDPPSPTALPSVSDDRRTSSELPDIPIDREDLTTEQGDEGRSPKVRSRLQLQASEDWPSPPSSPLFDTPVVSNVETFYMEMKPEEAIKVTVTDSTDTPENIGNDSDSSDENRTLHDDLHSGLLEDGQSSVSGTTIDGTVKVAVKAKSNSYITGSSHSEDTSMGLSMSEWSSSNNTVRQFCQYSGTKSDDNSLAELGASISDWSGSTTVIPQQYYAGTTPEKSQSDTTTSEKSGTSMRPNSKCQYVENPSNERGDDMELDESRFSKKQRQQQQAEFEGQDYEECQFPEGTYNDEIEFESMADYDQARNYEAAQFDEARKFVESQFDKHQFDDSKFDEAEIPRPIFTDISPPQITFQNEYDETARDLEDITEFADIPAIPGPPSIPEEDEEQLYDNVPAMKYSSSDQVRMEVTRGDSSEDMHERYASLASRTRYEYDRPIDDHMTLEEKLQKRFQEKPFNRFERGYSEPGFDQRHGTKSTERPVVVPIRAKSTPYYSTTSLSGESTTSSPPMQMKAQIRTKTMTYSSSRSPQSEGDTSSSMDSPGHTPERGARAFRRKRQQNIKRRHRVVVDLEVKDGQIVSSTDSSFDVANIPPPLLPEQSLDMDDDELFVTRNNRHQEN